jgi:hypothetical protein
MLTAGYATALRRPDIRVGVSTEATAPMLDGEDSA